MPLLLLLWCSEGLWCLHGDMMLPIAMRWLLPIESLLLLLAGRRLWAVWYYFFFAFMMKGYIICDVSATKLGTVEQLPSISKDVDGHCRMVPANIVPHGHERWNQIPLHRTIRHYLYPLGVCLSGRSQTQDSRFQSDPRNRRVIGGSQEVDSSNRAVMTHTHNFLNLNCHCAYLRFNSSDTHYGYGRELSTWMDVW